MKVPFSIATLLRKMPRRYNQPNLQYWENDRITCYNQSMIRETGDCMGMFPMKRGIKWAPTETCKYPRQVCLHQNLCSDGLGCLNIDFVTTGPKCLVALWYSNTSMRKRSFQMCSVEWTPSAFWLPLHILHTVDIETLTISWMVPAVVDPDCPSNMPSFSDTKPKSWNRSSQLHEFTFYHIQIIWKMTVQMVCGLVIISHSAGESKSTKFTMAQDR